MTSSSDKEPLDTYLGLCTEVYELSKPCAPSDAYTFYREYAREAARTGPILEPMCGSGRFLVPMLEEGFDIHGFDASQTMLDKLRAKVAALNLEAKVWQGFVEDLKQPHKYSLIFIPSGSFGLLSDLDQAKHALSIFCEHLADDGTLLVEVETSKALPDLGVWRGSLWPRSDGSTITLSQLASCHEGVCTSLAKYDLIANGKIIRTEVETYKIRLYDHDPLVTMLKAAGFTDVRAVKAFDRARPPNKGDASVVYECRKKSSSKS